MVVAKLMLYTDEQDRRVDNITGELEDAQKLLDKQQHEAESERKALKQKTEEMELDKKTFKRKLEEHMENEYKTFRYFCRASRDVQTTHPSLERSW